MRFENENFNITQEIRLNEFPRCENVQSLRWTTFNIQWNDGNGKAFSSEIYGIFKQQNSSFNSIPVRTGSSVKGVNVISVENIKSVYHFHSRVAMTITE